jgi:hypothetical protein
VALQGAVCKGWSQGKAVRSEREKKMVKERNKLTLLSVAKLPLDIWIHGISE